jgi:myo-inositol-1(or 4)-monophosphatase
MANQLRATAAEAARVGGAILMSYRQAFKANLKAPRDLVTDADIASQRAIADILLARFPDSFFVGEEEGFSSVRPEPGQLCWIVDPLDGTANYVHGLQNFSVSIAAAVDGVVLAGVVFDPTTNELFESGAGEGSWVNGERLSVSRCEEMDAALIACSFASSVHRDAPEIRQFVEVLVRCQALRRLGSAALNLCYVGAGRLDAYWALSVKPWDVAAGILIATEAGAVLTGVEGHGFDLWNPHLAIASTKLLHGALVECLV